jgi:hypothetical protein
LSVLLSSYLMLRFTNWIQAVPKYCPGGFGSQPGPVFNQIRLST